MWCLVQLGEFFSFFFRVCVRTSYHCYCVQIVVIFFFLLLFSDSSYCVNCFVISCPLYGLSSFTDKVPDYFFFSSTLICCASLSLSYLYFFPLTSYIYSLIRVVFGKIFLLTRHLIIVSQETRSRLNLIVAHMPKSRINAAAAAAI